MIRDIKSLTRRRIHVLSNIVVGHIYHCDITEGLSLNKQLINVSFKQYRV